MKKRGAFTWGIWEMSKINEIGNFRSAPYDEILLCPRCKLNFLPIGYPGALSRVDNETEICSECGQDEGLQDFFKTLRVAQKKEDE